MQGSQSKNVIFFEFSRVSTGAHQKARGLWVRDCKRIRKGERVGSHEVLTGERETEFESKTEGTQRKTKGKKNHNELMKAINTAFNFIHVPKHTLNNGHR